MTPWTTAVTRRSILAGAGALLAAPALLRPLAARGAVAATDAAGRAVSLEGPARRIVVGSSMILDALALAHPDPVALIAGWSGLAAVMDETQADSLAKRYPALSRIPLIGRMGADTMSLEAVVALAPDLVVLNLYDLETAGAPADAPTLRRLTDAGLRVAVVDFFVDPLRNSVPSLRLLGALLGSGERVEGFLAFYEARLDAVRRGLAGSGAARPSVFMHAHAAGAECCFSPGHGALDGFIDVAGGHNIGAEVLPGATGQLSLEYVLSRQAEVYVATAGYARGSESGFTLGRGVPPEAARESFARLLERPTLAALGAVEAGRAHGLWHDFTHSPLHVVAIEAMASWFHPRLFGGLDPAATLAEINERHLAVPLDGTFWLTAEPKAAGGGG